ncbi:hypothetical protein [Nitrosopumilus sp.]|uniref:hypothetical protein n=1 Tax=Nitrosopumilus sp. TaxID=2024843 RepID=UPI002930C489|nr:hypothetical protein [Nitrosopumilus sp.]
MTELIHNDVKLIGPLEQLHEKQEYLAGAKKAFPRFSVMKVLDQYYDENGMATILDISMHTPLGYVIVNYVEHTKVVDNKVVSTVAYYDPRKLAKSFDVLEGKDLLEDDNP